MSPLVFALLTGSVLLCTSGCKRESAQKNVASAPAGPDRASWPAPPEDGSQLSVIFQEMIGSGERLGARMRVINHADAPVTDVVLRLSYRDERGEEIGYFPMRMQGIVVPPNGERTLPMGGATPGATVRIEVRPQFVERSIGGPGKAAQKKQAWGTPPGPVNVPADGPVSPSTSAPSGAPPTGSP